MPKRRNAPTVRHHSSASGQETEVVRLTRERDEALEREIATSEILRLVSMSPSDLELVFRSILENATRICEAKFGALWRVDGANFRFAAEVGTPPELAEFLRHQGPFAPTPGTLVDRVMRTKQVSRTDDYAAEAVRGRTATLGKARSTIGVPMLKDGALIGAILIYRQEVRPFTDKQIELVKNFAAQAVIAIENARLLNELRESLDRQTATADVLRVISSSPGELEPVFNEILQKATRICRADYGSLLLCDGDAFRAVAHHNMPPEIVEKRWHEPLFRPGPASSLTQVAKSKEVVQIPDIAADQGYLEQNPERMALVEFGGYRSILTVPMLRDEELIGAFNIFRREVGLFNDKQIALAQNFAAQAVIAIENARLLSELRESLEQQTATADVLRVISSSPSDLQPVFNAMLENATRLCEAKFGVLFRFDGNAFHLAAQVGTTPEYAEFLERRGPFQPRAGRST